MIVGRHAVIWCGLVAMALGLAYMAAGGAPLTYLIMNASAFAIGVASVAILSRVTIPVSAGAMCLGLAGLLLASFLVGTGVEGATRWLRVGNVIVQPTLILVPLLTIAFARSRDWAGATGISLAALVLALQPDRGMSGALAAGLLTLTFLRPGTRTLAALATALAGFATAMLRPDNQGAMPFVDGILVASFDVHPLAGVAVIAGSLILLLPAVIGRGGQEPEALHRAVFGAVWITVLGAAALGNYPTPLVGYGGSAIIGYLLCSVALGRGHARAIGSSDAPGEVPRDDSRRLFTRPV